jgi:hypothetical protein
MRSEDAVMAAQELLETLKLSDGIFLVKQAFANPPDYFGRSGLYDDADEPERQDHEGEEGRAQDTKG